MSTVSSADGDRVVEAYYADVRNKRLLSLDFEQELFAAYRTCTKCGNAFTGAATEIRCTKCNHPRNMRAREQIVEGCLRFVVKEAKDYARRAKGFNYKPSLLTDLISAGNWGLLLAVDRFDPKAGNRFLTYAVHWIRMKIREELDGQDLVRIPSYRQKALRARRKQGDPTVPDTPAVVLEHVTEIDAKHSDADMEQQLLNTYGNEAIHKALDDLGFRARDKYIILAYYGVKDVPRNLCQISDQLELSAERVRVIKKQTMERIRAHLQENSITETEDVFTT